MPLWMTFTLFVKGMIKLQPSQKTTKYFLTRILSQVQTCIVVAIVIKMYSEFILMIYLFSFVGLSHARACFHVRGTLQIKDTVFFVCVLDCCCGRELLHRMLIDVCCNVKLYENVTLFCRNIIMECGAALFTKYN